MTSNWLILMAVALESGGIAGLFSPLAPDMQLTAYLTAHAMACACLSLVILPLLPGRYRGQPLMAGLFLFSVQFAIPFLGSLGVLVGILLALYLPRSQREIPWQEIDIPELPFRPLDLNQQVIYSQGGLRQVLREAGDADKRLQALMATRQMPDRDAVDILREALKDPADDVRLLAYSMLEQKEKTLTQRASLVQQALEQGSDKETLSLRRRLAQVWWEMAYLGLAQGGLRTYYLNNAATALTDIIRQRPHHGDWRLLGRVELARDNLEAAEQAFQQAQANGSPPEVILPYLAELAFLRRDFDRVRECLAACPRDRLHPANRPLLEAWL
ncbi:MAG: HEAT repeat domain-containing protein [Marinobacter sp.]|uniref:HEAT repeat domain-containing protein n=1 Tax=Marinobacter sp. TaxID=50741 RepID=UPI00299DF310|nr:HEAT repeat domain-containing protein [Marinobacter sp.]MDX1635066.1 HEAT repeat domain-containing protein [Marinobacter sp.]